MTSNIPARTITLKGMPMSGLPKHDFWGILGQETLIHDSIEGLVKHRIDNCDHFGIDEDGQRVRSGSMDVLGGDQRYGSLVDYVSGDEYCIELLLNIPDHCNFNDNKSVLKECRAIASDMDVDVYESYNDDFWESPETSESVMPRKMINQVARIIYRGVKQYIKTNGHLGCDTNGRDEQIANMMRRRLIRLLKHTTPFRLYYLDLGTQAALTITDGEITDAIFTAY